MPQVRWGGADGVGMPKLSSASEHELASYAAVSALLWNERELLEQVVYKLTVQHQLLAAGSTRWLNHANAEVRAAISQVSGTEVLRMTEIETLADTLNLPHETTLGELAAIAPEPGERCSPTTAPHCGDWSRRSTRSARTSRGCCSRAWPPSARRSTA